MSIEKIIYSQNFEEKLNNLLIEHLLHTSMKRGKRDGFTPNGIDYYFVTVMTDNRFKQQFGTISFVSSWGRFYYCSRPNDPILPSYPYSSSFSRFLLSRLLYLWQFLVKNNSPQHWVQGWFFRDQERKTASRGLFSLHADFL